MEPDSKGPGKWGESWNPLSRAAGPTRGLRACYFCSPCPPASRDWLSSMPRVSDGQTNNWGAAAPPEVGTWPGTSLSCGMGVRPEPGQPWSFPGQVLGDCQQHKVDIMASV